MSYIPKSIFGKSIINNLLVTGDQTSFACDLIPEQTSTYNIGTTSQYWQNLYVNNGGGGGGGSYTATLPILIEGTVISVNYDIAKLDLESNNLSVKDSYVRGLFSSTTEAITYDNTDGKFTFNLDDTKLAIVSNKVTLIDSYITSLTEVQDPVTLTLDSGKNKLGLHLDTAYLTTATIGGALTFSDAFVLEQDAIDTDLAANTAAITAENVRAEAAELALSVGVAANLASISVINGEISGFATSFSTGQLFSTINTNSYPNLLLTNNYTGNYCRFLDMVSPNTPVGNVCEITLGVADSNYNEAAIQFNYNGVSSTSNSIGFGFYGANNLLTIDGLGNIVNTGNITSSGQIFSTINDIYNANIVCINNTSSNVKTCEYLAPNLNNGNRLEFHIGVSEATNNIGVIQYNYVGSNSSSNSLGFGFYGNNNLMSIDGSGLFTAATATLSALNVINNSSTSLTNAQFLMPSLNNGDTNAILIGVDNYNPRNAAIIDFNYSGSSSPSNTLEFGFTDSPAMMILDAGGDLTVNNNNINCSYSIGANLDITAGRDLVASRNLSVSGEVLSNRIQANTLCVQQHTAQSMSNTIVNTVLFDGATFNTSGTTGITYSTGIFINSNSYSVICQVSYNIAFAGASAATYKYAQIIAPGGNYAYSIFPLGSTFVTSLNGNAIITLAPGSTFYIGCGVGVTESTNSSGAVSDYSTSCSILVLQKV